MEPRGDPDNPTATAVFSALFDQELGEARRVSASLEARGQGVIASSGTLMVLILAITGLQEGVGVSGPPAARALAIFALLLFGTAAAAGLWVSWPRYYEEITRDKLREIAQTPGLWRGDGMEAARKVAVARLHTLEVARKINSAKAWWLRAAIAAEAFAVVALGVAVTAAIGLA